MREISRREFIRFGAAGTAVALTAGVVTSIPAIAADARSPQVREDEWEYDGRKIFLRTTQVGDEVRHSVTIDGVNLHVMKDRYSDGWLSSMVHYSPTTSIRELAEASVDATAGFALRPINVEHDHH